MFHLGFTEVTIVCIVALIIVGPERLPKLKLLKNIDEINSNFDLICLTVEHKYFFSKNWENHIIKEDIKDKIIFLRDL